MLLLLVLVFTGMHLGAIELKTHSGDFVETSVFQEDYMYLGERLQFKGETEDLFFAGEEFDFTGTSKLGVFSVGRRIDVSGSIGNGLIAAGRTINIDGVINDTIMLAAEKITIHSNSQIKGDSFMAGRIVNIEGIMEGDAKISAAEVIINNIVKGDISVYAGQLKIPENGKIIGNLIYESDQEITAEEASRITGTIRFEKNEESQFIENFKSDYFSKSLLFSFLFKLSFIICGLLILLFPITKHLEQTFTYKKVISNALWGLIPIFIYPSALLISIVLVITLPLSLTLLLGLIPLIFITKTIGIMIIGNFLAGFFNLNINNRFVFFLIGAFFYTGLSFIPFFGILLLLFVSSIGWGIIIAPLIAKKLT